MPGSIIPDDWRPKELGTLVYLLREGSVLLINKRRGHGAGKVNAPGGRVEPGETVEACAIREVREEVGIRVESLTLAATLRFHDPITGLDMQGFAYTSLVYTGTPQSTAEAEPFWCRLEAVPYARMWEDDRLWLPAVLRGGRVRGDFVFDNDRLIEHVVKEIDGFDPPGG